MNIGTLTGQLEIEDELSHRLTLAAHAVGEFTSEFGALGKTVAIAGGAIIGTIGGISATIIGLGNRGADVNDVAATFENFSGSIDIAKASMDAMKEGTLGTVDDFDLMKNASKLLAGGVKLTSAQFGDLSSAAFILQNQGLGPTKDMLDLVSQAMLTGRTRSLEMKIGKIDLKQAEKDYAKSLGTTKDQLSQAGKTEAARIAILEALNRKVKEAGQQHRDFGEQMEFAIVKIKNWGDELAQRVAASPAVTNAIESIGNALVENFGGAGKTALEVIVSWIDRFARGVAYYGPIVIKAVSDISKWIYDVWTSIRKSWDDAPEWFKRMTIAAGGATLAIKGTQMAVETITGADILSNVASAATIWSGFGSGITRAMGALKNFAAIAVFTYQIGGLSGLITGLGFSLTALIAPLISIPALVTGAFIGLGFGIWQVAKAIDAAAKSSESWWQILTRKDDSNWLRDMLGFSTKLKEFSAIQQERVGTPTISPGFISGGAAAARQRDEQLNKSQGYDGPPLVVDETAEKIDRLIKSWKDASKESAIFKAAFDSLTPAQRANRDIQEMLVGEINKMVAAQKPLSSGMREVIEADQARRVGLLESNRLTMESSDLTLVGLDAMKRAGLTETDIARAYDVTTDALQRRITALQEAATRQEALGAFNHALVEQQQQDSERLQAKQLAGNKEIADSQEQLDNLRAESALTTTQIQMRAIDKETTAAIAGFKGTEAQLKDFTDVQIALSHTKKSAILVDNDVLKENARSTLQEQANKARTTYEIMAAYPAEFSKDTIKHFKEIADEAQRHANGTKSAWEKAFAALNYTAQIADTIPGKFGAIARAAVSAAQNIANGFAQGGIVGGIVAGVAEGIKAISKLFGETAYEKRTKEEAKALAEAAKQMRNLASDAVKAAGSAERLALNAKMVGVNLKSAFDSKSPEYLSELLDSVKNKTDKLNAAMDEYGFTWQDLGDEFRGAALGDLFDQLLEKTDLLKGAGINYDEILKRQSGSYSDLVQKAIATHTEIPIAMEPVLQDLTSMHLLLDKNGDAFENLDDISWAKTLTQGFDAVTDAIHELTDAITNGVGGAIDKINSRRIHIPTSVDNPDLGSRGDGSGIEQPAYYTSGGRVLDFRARGTDTVPAMLTPGETVIPRGGGGGTAIIEINGRRIAEIVVPQIPGVVKRMGIK